MIRETVVAVDATGITTESGPKICLGNRRFDTGEDVWTEGRYAFGNERRNTAPVVLEGGEGISSPGGYFVVCAYTEDFSDVLFRIYDKSMECLEVPLSIASGSLEAFCYNSTATVFACVINNDGYIGIKVSSDTFTVKKYLSSGLESIDIKLPENAILVDCYVDDGGNVITRFFASSLSYYRRYDGSGNPEIISDGDVKFYEYTSGAATETVDVTEKAKIPVDACWNKLAQYQGALSYEESDDHEGSTGAAYSDLASRHDMSGYRSPTGNDFYIYHCVANWDKFARISESATTEIKYLKYEEKKFMVDARYSYDDDLNSIFDEYNREPSLIGTMSGSGVPLIDRFGFDTKKLDWGYGWSAHNTKNPWGFNISCNKFYAFTSDKSELVLDYLNGSDTKKALFWYADYNVNAYELGAPFDYGSGSSDSYKILTVSGLPGKVSARSNIVTEYDVGDGYKITSTIAYLNEDTIEETWTFKLSCEKLGASWSIDITSLLSGYGYDTTLPGSVVDISEDKALLVFRYDMGEMGENDAPYFIEIDKKNMTAQAITNFHFGAFNTRMPMIHDVERADIYKILSAT